MCNELAARSSFIYGRRLVGQGTSQPTNGQTPATTINNTYQYQQTQEYRMAEQRMKSYEMIPDRIKKRYLEFYDELYHPERSAIDLKTKELIAIAASVVSDCKGCFRGHVLKAVRAGASREEVGEAIAIAIAISGAAIVDRTDVANEEFDLVRKLWENGAKNEEVDETTP